MPKIIRVYDPDEVERRIQFLIKDSDYPGLLKVLGSLPHGAESPLIRFVLYQWFLRQKKEGTLESTIEVFIAELTSKKKTGGSKVGRPTQGNISGFASVPDALIQSQDSYKGAGRLLHADNQVTPNRQLTTGPATNQAGDSNATIGMDRSQKTRESHVQEEDGNFEIDDSMLADISSFLG